MRCGQTPGVRARACGSEHERRWRLRWPDDRLCANGAHRRSPVCSARPPPPPWPWRCSRIAFCQPIRPRSAISSRCRSRWVGSVSAVSLGTAPVRGGTTTRRLGMALGDRGVHVPPVIGAVAGERGDRSPRPDRAMARPASRHRRRWWSAPPLRSGRCRHPRPGAACARTRRVLVPCFSVSHSPGPPSLRPVLSTSRCTGPEPGLDRGRGTSRVSARRLSVEWSGTARSSPSRWRMEPISPSVWRSARRNTARSVSAVSDRQGRVPGLPAAGRARLRAPGRDRLIAEPDRQAPALTQAGVVFAPSSSPGSAAWGCGDGQRHGP